MRKYLGAKPGILAALHTWSQTLVLHPHVHCLVTGGGVTQSGDWKAVRHGFLLPARVVMAVFRGKMLGRDPAGVEAWGPRVPGGAAASAGLNLLTRLGHPTEEPVERTHHGALPARSRGDDLSARYLRGGPLKNARLVAWDGDRVTFTCRARHEEADGARPGLQRMTLPVADFLQRWLLHVPSPPDPRGAVLWAVPSSTQRRSRCAGRARATARGGTGAWSGRPCVPSVGTRIRSGVPPVASSSCVRALSRGEEPRPAWPQRSAPHEIRTTGSPARGVVCLVAARGRDRPVSSAPGRLRAPCTSIAPASVGPAEPVTGRITGRPQWKLHSVRLPKPGQAASVRGQSNQVLSEVLRAGRESTAGLSPLSTPDSILMCYRNL